MDLGAPGERQPEQAVVACDRGEPHGLLRGLERPRVVRSLPPADPDVVVSLRHPPHQPGLLIGGEGELVAGQRGLGVALERGDDAEIVEAAGLRGMVPNRARQVQRFPEALLRLVHVAVPQRDGAAVVEGTQLRRALAPRPRRHQREL